MSHQKHTVNMDYFASRREKFFVHNSLLAIPIMLIGQPILIDLRNETSVAGRIKDVDGFMNITLEEVVYIDQKDRQYEFSNFMIQARMLRQMHIPDSIDVIPELRRFLEAIGTRRKRDTNVVKTSKVRRAMDRHKRTVKEINS